MLLATGAIVLLTVCDSIRPDEFECEHGIAHLRDCCPELALDDDDCLYHPSGCGSAGWDPLLSEADASCIQELSCDDIHAGGLCEAVQERSDQPPSERETARLCY